MRWLVAAVLVALSGSVPSETLVPAATAAEPASRTLQTLPIGYLSLRRDRRYHRRHLRARLRAQPWGRPLAGAELAVRESRFQAQAAGFRVRLERRKIGDTAGALAALGKLSAKGVHFVLLDLPGAAVAEVATGSRGLPLTLFNVSAFDDALRQERCGPNLLHTFPSRAMQMDALAQYLVSRNWRRVLVLAGPDEGDRGMLIAFERSAQRFALEIVARRSFVLGKDPRSRRGNNVALLTGGEDYDVVFVADATGEFAREVPYRLLRPRPTAGAAGLVPVAWHWSFERYGAPQLNGRFLKRAGRPMTGFDWAAWMAVKAVVEAAVRTASTDHRVVERYLRGPELVLDAFKGYRSSFRPWNGQLRQAMLLTTGDWVVDRAPLPGFLHRRETLDTLGYDAPESRCPFPWRAR